MINRGNCRHDISEAERTKAAFLKCLDEACEKTGWRIHAWYVMSNHYHLAVETPQANLVGGMSWLQGTFPHGSTVWPFDGTRKSCRLRESVRLRLGNAWIPYGQVNQWCFLNM